MASRIDDLRRQLRDALVEEGVYDEATADAVLLSARASTPDLMGNYADIQRMGSIALQDRIPTPPGEDDEETSDIQQAFKEPEDLSPLEDPGYKQANEGANAGAMQQETVSPTVEAEAPGGAEGAEPEEGAEAEEPEEGDAGLESMTKAELQDEANRRGVSVSSSMTKQEMIDAMGGV